jgi:hypothetical protein
MKLFLKLYGIHILYVLIGSQFFGLIMFVHSAYVDGAISANHSEDDTGILESILFMPLISSFMLTKLTIGLYWLIPLLYFFKKINKYLIWIFSVEIIMYCVIVISVITGDEYAYNKKLSYIIQDISILLFVFILTHYKYKHINRILENNKH